MKLIVASNNEHKTREIREMLEGSKYEVLSLKDVKVDIDPEETGKTFEENAYIKAKAIYEEIKKKKNFDEKFYVLADDSGLMVDYLKGAPGVYSARYSEDTSINKDKSNNKKLLEDLKNVPKDERKAQFVCALVLLGKKKDIRVKGKSEGYIIEEETGLEGFGYDPLFLSKDLGKTFAEATSVEKNSVSHRARALEKLKKELEK